MKRMFKKFILIFYCFLGILCFLSFFGSEIVQATIITTGDYECDDTGGTWSCFTKPGETINFQVSAVDPDGDKLFFLFYWGDVAGYVQKPDGCPPNSCIASGAVPPYSIGHSFATSSPGSYARACDEHNTSIPPDLDQCSDVSNTIITHVSQFNSVTHKVNTTSSPSWKDMPIYLVESNDVITYKVSFMVGAGAMHKLLVQDDLPANTTFVASSGNCGTYNAPGSRAGNRVTWDLNTVDVIAGSVCDFSVSVRRTPNDCASNIALKNKFTLSAQNADTATGEGTVTINCPKNWWQTFWGDIHAQSSILNKEPDPSVDKSADFMITAGSGISGAHSRELSEIAPYHQLSFFAVDIEGLANGKYGQFQNTGNGHWLGTGITTPPAAQITKPLWWGAADDPSSNVWLASGLLKIAQNEKELFLERGGTVLVDGNLEIDGDLFYDPNFDCDDVPNGIPCRKALPSAGFVATGDLIIGPKVRHLVGNFYVLGDVYTDGTEDTELIIEGSLVARGALNLEREYKGAGDDPAEIVRYDGRVLVNPPPGFLDPATILPNWAWIRP